VDVTIIRNTFAGTGGSPSGDGIEHFMTLASPTMRGLVVVENVGVAASTACSRRRARRRHGALTHYAPGAVSSANLLVGLQAPALTLPGGDARLRLAGGDVDEPGRRRLDAAQQRLGGLGATLSPLRAMAAAVVANGN
jgi:hypothetical protein